MTSTSANINNNPTPAQEEFQDFLDKNTEKGSRVHPEDRESERSDGDDIEDEEDRYRNAQIEAAMRVPTLTGDVKLPPSSFDSGRSTGVKGVIADARAYEQARQSNWRNRVRAARQSVFGRGETPRTTGSHSGESEDDEDEDAFLQQWRESRRQELERDAKNSIRSRRTSPSLRMFGRLDTVDALGYLDAIEKVGRETVVVVFVYDHEVSQSSARLIKRDPNADRMIVRSVGSHRISVTAACHCPSRGSFRQGALRRHRIRQCCRAYDLSVPEPRRPICKLDRHH